VPKIEDLFMTLSPGAQALVEVGHRADHLVAIIRGSQIASADTPVKIFSSLRTTMAAHSKQCQDMGVNNITFDSEDATINFHVGRGIFALTTFDIRAIHDAQISD